MCNCCELKPGDRVKLREGAKSYSGHSFNNIEKIKYFYPKNEISIYCPEYEYSIAEYGCFRREDLIKVCCHCCECSELNVGDTVKFNSNYKNGHCLKFKFEGVKVITEISNGWPCPYRIGNNYYPREALVFVNTKPKQWCKEGDTIVTAGCNVIAVQTISEVWYEFAGSDPGWRYKTKGQSVYTDRNFKDKYSYRVDGSLANKPYED